MWKIIVTTETTKLRTGSTSKTMAKSPNMEAILPTDSTIVKRIALEVSSVTVIFTTVMLRLDKFAKSDGLT